MITVRAKRVCEDVSARRWAGQTFGERGTAWATVVDVTLCDVGGRRARRRVSVPTRVALWARSLVAPTLDLTVLLLVRSPGFDDIPVHFRSPTLGERSLVQESWDLRAVASWVARTVAAVGPASGDDLIAALQGAFWVDDPDDDQWSDVPIEDGPDDR